MKLQRHRDGDYNRWLEIVQNNHAGECKPRIALKSLNEAEIETELMRSNMSVLRVYTSDDDGTNNNFEKMYTF